MEVNAWEVRYLINRWNLHRGSFCFTKNFQKAEKIQRLQSSFSVPRPSIGANINEAVYGNSKADFIAKLHISLKETGESIYWLSLLKRADIFEYNYDSLLSQAEEIKRMLIASINTAKGNKNEK